MIKRSVICAAMCTTLLGTAASAQNLSDRYEQVMQRRAQQQQNQGMDTSRLLGVLLYTDISVTFDEVEAREAINHLSSILGINIIGRYDDDRVGTGIDPTTPITLSVQNQPALNVLQMVLAQCEDGFQQVDWQIRQGIVEVGTKERLASRAAQEIRYYPVRDLLFEVPHFDNAPSISLFPSQGQGGGRGGGGGGGGGGLGGGGGGGFGGGGGGGGGGGQGGGGGPFRGDYDDPDDRLTEEEKVEELIDVITETIEPEAWVQMGGDQASIRYYQGVLIVRAPDFIHRQLGGYPAPTPPGGQVRANEGDMLRFVQHDGGVGYAQIRNGVPRIIDPEIHAQRGNGAPAQAGGGQPDDSN